LRLLTNIAALVVSVVLGYFVTIIVTSPAGFDPSLTPQPGPVMDRGEEDVPAPGNTSTSQPVSTVATTVETFLVWSTGGLTPGLTGSLTAEFPEASVVKGDVVELEAANGRLIPLDGVAVEPDDHRPFDPTGSLAQLLPGTVVLGATSATLRDAEPGDFLVIGGKPFEIVGITPDETVGAAEVVFAASDPDSPVQTDRFVLIATEIPRTTFEGFVRSSYDGPAPLRIRAEGETPWLRHGDAVAPQVFIKLALGEFSYTNRSGSEFIQDQEFLDENIAEFDVPILGSVICHKVVAEMLVGAMAQLVDEGLAYLVDPSGFRGCWNPRFIRSASGTPAGVSRHAWGAGVDLNASANPVGSVGTQDPRLIAIMLEWGFTWGGDWLVPDPMHFEYAVP
jgi:hypothetical protein